MSGEQKRKEPLDPGRGTMLKTVKGDASMSKESMKIKTSDKKAMAALLEETARKMSERYKAGEPPLMFDEPFKGEIRDLPGRFGKG